MAVNREQVVQAAEKLVAKGKIEAAIKEYRKVLDDSPSDTTTLNRVGDLWARLNKNEEAIRVYTQTAGSFTEDGFFVKAIAIYKKVIKLDPTRLEVYEKLADLYHRQGLTNEARTQYQVLIDYYLKHSNAASAISILLKMVELEPENPTHHVKLADIYRQQKLVDKAMGEYKIIAEMMLSKGHAEEAAQVYLKALDVNANDMAFLTEAVLGLRDAGHNGPAAKLLAAAVEKNPQAERVAALAGLRGSGKAVAPAATPVELPPLEVVPPPPAFEPEPVEEFSWHSPELTPASEAPSFEAEAFAPAVEEIAAPEPPRRLPREDSFAGIDEEFVLDLDSDEPLPTEFRPPVAPPEPAPPPVAAAPAAPQPGAAARSYASPMEPAEEAPPAVSADEARPFELDLDLGIDSESVWDISPGQSPLGSASDLSPSAAPEPALPDLELPQEIEWSFDAEEAAPAAAVPSASGSASPRIDREFLERTAAEVQPAVVRREEDLVAEAEVFAKYGLQEKAEERLREALQLSPKHLGAHAQLILLLLHQGRHERVLQLANQMSQIAAGALHREVWIQTRQRLVKHGYRIDGEHVVAGPEAAAQEPDRIADLLGALAQTASAPPPPPAPAVEKKARGKRPEAALEDLASAFLKPTKSKAKLKAAPAPIAPPVEMLPPLEPVEAVEPIEHAEALPSISDVAPDELEGVVFPEEISTPEELAAGPAAEDSSLSWLDDVSLNAPSAAEAEEKLFDDEDDFFDLAAELERELTESDAGGARGLQPSPQPQEQSLEEIVEGFKKGVAENLSPEDYDTHFNLGIAYREMGLLDEAIGEFQLASKDVEHLVECCSMLGICFLDKGLPELAVKWYRRGLETPVLDEDRQLGLLYDMGNALDQAGDREAAYKTFVEIYGINSNYRDVVPRLQELGP
ncbi:MAG: tetratricopeptide repeat protein [Acidobacteriota bacterium]